MKLTAVYLKPKNGYKTPLRSDTLWGMLCWAIRNVYGKDELEKFIKKYNSENDNHVITSCFPYIAEPDGTRTHYFPVPLLPIKHEPIEAETYREYASIMTERKKLKKRKFLTKKEFENVLKTGKLPENKQEEFPKVDAFPVTRNTIDRLKGGTLQLPDGGQLFHVDEHHVQVKKTAEKAEKDAAALKDSEKEPAKNSGLFFIIKGDMPDTIIKTEDGEKRVLHPIKGALNYLRHTGFGGDRTVGKGWFEIDYKEDFKLDEPDGKGCNACTTLSLYHPTTNEINNFKSSNTDHLNYKIEMRGGRLGFFNYRKVQKDAIMMFEEGSVFPIQNTLKKQYGDNPIVLEAKNHPELHHNVSHYGMGFMVKMKL